MKKTNKTCKTDSYVVYHLGADESDQLPCYFKSQAWNDKCTRNLSKAFVTDDVLIAEDVADHMNEHATEIGHCLAGHIKFGKICITEVKRPKV